MSGLCYACLRALAILLWRIGFALRVEGQEHVPNRGGLLIAANHASYLDIPVLGAALRRRTAFLGRADLFPVPGFNWACRWLGWIPIRPGRLDREGFGKAISLIKAGQVVVIYPEGSRSLDGHLQRGKPGVGFLVAETGCPVVPAYIAGTHEALPVGAWWIRRYPLKVVFGPPLEFSVESRESCGKEFYQHVSRTVMAHIAALGRVAPPSEAPGSTAEDPARRSLNAEGGRAAMNHQHPTEVGETKD